MTSNQIKPLRTVSTYVKSANLVVASTCHLGETASDFPLAFGIDKVRSTPTGANYQGRRFFLGYAGVAYTNEMLNFETSFWQWATTGHNLGDAYDLALRATYRARGHLPDLVGQLHLLRRPVPSGPLLHLPLRRRT